MPAKFVTAPIVVLLLCGVARAEPIDRQAVVTRHNPVLQTVDMNAPVTVGNGGFAFSTDVTGLQTLANDYHRHGVPVETLSRWAWYTEPNPQGYQLADAFEDYVEADGRVVGYPTNADHQAGQWLRRNPRIHPLGQLAFVHADGTAITRSEITDVEQTLDLWRGVIASEFKLRGEPVRVMTTCHPELDLIAVRVNSPLLAEGKLAVKLAFPLGHDASVKNTPALAWSQPDSHSTRTLHQSEQRLDLKRQRDSLVYHCTLAWVGDAQAKHSGPHAMVLEASDGELEFTVSFAPDPLPTELPSFDATLQAAAEHWRDYWTQGGAVDFAGSSDPRAAKLEQRIVLSRYLEGVQCAGEVPPQETGLTCATWYGKHHTEMIWWHTAHFALWGHDQLLAKNLRWYIDHLPTARQLAQSRGLEGARWAKMVGPDGRESPGGNPLIVWNQPHPVYLAELLYRNTPNRETLDRYSPLVFATAECLVSMVHYDQEQDAYVLGPPLWIAQEIYDRATSQNPSFELAYWRWALETAQQWRTRQGLPRNEQWDHVITNLAPLPQQDGKYVALGSHPDTWDNLDSRHDHPTMLAPLGVLPGGPMVNRATMNRTLDAVLAEWDWETKIWGWDYPMIAMTATRLGRPEDAVEILLRDGPNNIYYATGHCPQRSDQARRLDDTPGARRHEIATYLPANGSFLSAVALMVAGWDDCDTPLPGFPQDGTWKIRHEGLHPLP
ncbi:hypothetical protein NG895_08615 [Aeoliella sp. ICT_H6.2]|uniref:Glycosyl hydrolase family 65 n=1 Tax=Aeoliella straminimaris TaxID=2954799 RepID=A0A9X2F971_9BACT|nr:hypothetical protein [Aeoliella straminimaris]MCO6043968.1 hypothetical protein [Aeoliella straminimaris]